MNLSYCFCTRRLALGLQFVYSADKVIPDGYTNPLNQNIQKSNTLFTSKPQYSKAQPKIKNHVHNNLAWHRCPHTMFILGSKTCSKHCSCSCDQPQIVNGVKENLQELRLILQRNSTRYPRANACTPCLGELDCVSPFLTRSQVLNPFAKYYLVQHFDLRSIPC